MTNFSTYSERRLQLALNHEFPTRTELESMIMLLISEADVFNPVDFGFLYHMIETSTNYGRADRIALYRRFHALDIPVETVRTTKVSKHCTGLVRHTIFTGLFMPLDMPLLDLLLDSGWVPETDELLNVAGASELRWVIERIHGMTTVWRAKLIGEIIRIGEPRRTAFLDYLFDIEGWDLTKSHQARLRDTLAENVAIYRKYKAHLCLFPAPSDAITYLNKVTRTGDSVGEIIVEALEIAAPEIKRSLLGQRRGGNRVLDEAWGCLLNVVGNAMRAGDSGLLERTLAICHDHIRTPEAAHWKRDRYMRTITQSAVRALRLDPWRILFKYIPVDLARTEIGHIPRLAKFNKFAEEVRMAFREQYGVDAPVRAGGPRARIRRGAPAVDEEPVEDEDIDA